MNAWSTNVAVIERRWPELAARLACIQTKHAQLNNGVLTYRGARVVSAHDRLTEAKAQYQAMANPTRCYGFGLGELPGLMASRGPVKVVLPNLEIARVALENTDAYYLLKYPAFELAAADAVEWTDEPFAAVAGECWLADTQGYEVRDRVFIKIHERVQVRFQLTHAERTIEQHKANKERRRYPAEALYGKALGSKAVAIAAGPSLTGQLEWLKTSGLRPIIACAAALRPLLATGIVPEVVVMMENDDISLKYFEGYDLSPVARKPLVHSDEADPRILDLWPGETLHCAASSSVNADQLYLGGTVMHTAIDLACRMGAVEVTMLGFDCCRPGRSAHADGVVSPAGYPDTPFSMWTTDGYRNDVLTDPAMTQWHRHAEDLIRARPSVKFYKRGRAGVTLRGSIWLD